MNNVYVAVGGVRPTGLFFIGHPSKLVVCRRHARVFPLQPVTDYDFEKGFVPFPECPFDHGQPLYGQYQYLRSQKAWRDALDQYEASLTHTLRMDEFIERHQIRIEAKRLEQRTDGLMEEPERMFHWLVTLSRGELAHKMTVQFSMGLGHAEIHEVGSFAKHGIQDRPRSEKFVRGKLVDLLRFGGITIWKDYMRIRSIADLDRWAVHYEMVVYPTPPTTADVLDSIVSSCASYEDAGGDIGDWAEEFGYTNVGQALKVFRAVENERQEAIKFLGHKLYEILLRQVERL